MHETFTGSAVSTSLSEKEHGKTGDRMGDYYWRRLTQSDVKKMVNRYGTLSGWYASICITMIKHIVYMLPIHVGDTCVPTTSSICSTTGGKTTNPCMGIAANNINNICLYTKHVARDQKLHSFTILFYKMATGS